MVIKITPALLLLLLLMLLLLLLLLLLPLILVLLMVLSLRSSLLSLWLHGIRGEVINWNVITQYLKYVIFDSQNGIKHPKDNYILLLNFKKLSLNNTLNLLVLSRRLGCRYVTICGFQSAFVSDTVVYGMFTLWMLNIYQFPFLPLPLQIKNTHLNANFKCILGLFSFWRSNWQLNCQLPRKDKNKAFKKRSKY